MANVESLSNQLIEFFEKFSSWEQDVVKGTDITLPQMHALEILGAQGHMRMKELAEIMGVTTGTLTVLVDRLEKKQLVERLADEKDRRVVLVALTPSGAKASETHHDLHIGLTSEMTADLSADEIATLSGLISKLSKRI